MALKDDVLAEVKAGRGQSATVIAERLGQSHQAVRETLFDLVCEDKITLTPDTFRISEEQNYTQVATFADLPTAADYSAKIFVVLQTTGVIFVNRKLKGLYRSDGVEWSRLGDIYIEVSGPSGGFLPSNPPSGKCAVTNLWWDPATGKIAGTYDDVPVS